MAANGGAEKVSGAPEWIELLPPGRDIQGRDGRRWVNDDPAGIVTAFRADGVAIPLDYDHATESAASQGAGAPAAGWIEDLQTRADGSIWGRIAWTAKARAMVEAKEYRFISPAFLYNRVTAAIRKLTSAALTHHPNLKLAAVNHAGDIASGSMVLALNRASAATPLLSPIDREICGRLGLDPAAFARAKGEC